MQSIVFSQNNNSNINSKFTKNSLFLFNTFEDGTAYFDDGGIAKARCNYNVVYDELCYIKNSEILVISNTNELDSIKIGNALFRYLDSKIFETIHQGKISIFLNRKANVPSENPTGAYGTESNTSAVTKHTSIYSNYGAMAGDHVNMHNENDFEIKVDYKFYLLIDNNLILATKGQINKTFKSHKSEIKSYIKENNIDLQNIEDLTKLTTFLEKLL